MSKAVARASIALVVAATWGVFADLRHGQIGWFLLRVGLAVGVTYLASLWFDREDPDLTPPD